MVKNNKNQYNPLEKPSKSGIVVIYMLKIDDFVFFEPFYTKFEIKRRQLADLNL